MSTSATTAKTSLGRLAVHSTATCSVQASVYGKCILATYTDVTKDVCKDEFAKFAKCLREAVYPPLALLFCLILIRVDG
ncbi:hypothetical protein K438DRAFT_12057 [Mycena galopus ATCC 62051]|nr:hypothetical protein K438DRAFT_12057 [Mycena galopus ATCC 62051]